MALLSDLNILIILLAIILPNEIKGLGAPNGNGFDNFTIIKFLKDLQHLHYYDTILLMHNRNATIAKIFYANVAIQPFDAQYNNADEGDNADTATPGHSLFHFGVSDAALDIAGHLMQHIQVPVLQFNEMQSFYLKPYLSEYILAIVQIDIFGERVQDTMEQHRELLMKMRQNMRYMTEVKLVLLINHTIVMDTSGSELINGTLVSVLRLCWQHQFINVIAVMADYKTSGITYRFNPFPTFQLETLAIARDPRQQTEVFPNRLSDLKGHRIPIVVGGTEPRIIRYKTKGDQSFVGGFVGHFMLAFAKRYNCTLYEPKPYDPKSVIPSQDLIRAVTNGTVEWSAAITFPLIPFRGYSYPYEHLNLCIMIPLDPKVPDYKFFTSVFRGEAYILVIGSLVLISMVLSSALYVHGYSIDFLDFLCHDNCLRGILAQSFAEIAKPPKIVSAIYLEICILGILLTTAYNAHFSTYVTKAPKQFTRSNLDDILSSGLKVISFEPEYKEFMERAADLKKYKSVFIREPSLKKYVQQRDSFDTKFGYVVPTTKWTIVTEQQKIFTTPLFKLTPGLCFFNNIPTCFPVQENSVFTPLLNKLILEVYQMGLMSFWREYGFLELIRAKSLALSDLSPKIQFKPMQVGDLQYIFVFLALMLLIVIGVFTVEQFVFNRREIQLQLFAIVRRFDLIWVAKRNNTYSPHMESGAVIVDDSRCN